MILNMVGGGSAAGSGFPEFTYTGAHQLVDDGKVSGKQNWRLKLLTSGTLNFTKIDGSLDVFLAGGGGSGGPDGWSSGGGGGYTKNIIGLVPNIGSEYSIVIGAGGASVSTGFVGNDGGITSAFGSSALGGKRGQNRDVSPEGKGGDGGSGGGGQCGFGNITGGNGSGGSDGGDGQGGGNGSLGGKGQGTTTRAFGDINGELYCGGGSGAHSSNFGGTPGAGGGGEGVSNSNPSQGKNGVTNTGGGGGGMRGAGGSGIVILRNHRG